MPRFNHYMRVERRKGDDANDWERQPDRWDQVGHVHVLLRPLRSSELTEAMQRTGRTHYRAIGRHHGDLVKITDRFVSEQDGRVFGIDSIVDPNDHRRTVEYRLIEDS